MRSQPVIYVYRLRPGSECNPFDKAIPGKHRSPPCRPAWGWLIHTIWYRSKQFRALDRSRRKSHRCDAFYAGNNHLLHLRGCGFRCCSTADHHGGKAHGDHSAMGRAVAHARRRFATDQHRGRALDDGIGRPHTDAAIAKHRCGHATDEHGGAAWPDHWPPHMGDRWHPGSLHRAGVQIGEAGGGGHGKVGRRRSPSLFRMASPWRGCHRLCGRTDLCLRLSRSPALHLHPISNRYAASRRWKASASPPMSGWWALAMRQ
jgi:hypothetical protein